MSQNTIIGVLIGIIVAGGGFWYYQTNIAGNGGAATDRGGSERNSVIKDDGNVLDRVSGTLADIFSRGDAAQCEFSGIDPDTKEPVDGMLYVSGDSYRMEVDTVIDGTALRLHLIEHDNVFYMWSDNPEAMPPLMVDNRTIVKMNERQGIPQEKPESPIDWLKEPNSGVDYKCKGWSPRRDSFEPPSNIEFVDMFGEMGRMMQGMFDPAMMGGDAGMDWGME